MIHGLHLSFWLVVIEIFLPLGVWLTCLRLNTVIIVRLRGQKLKSFHIQLNFPLGFVVIFPPLLIRLTCDFFLFVAILSFNSES